MNYVFLSSRKNPVIVNAALLSTEKKARDKENLFVTEGIKLFNEALSMGLTAESVFFTQKALSLYGEALEKLDGNVKTFLVTDEVFAKLSTENAPQGIYACFTKPHISQLTDDILKMGGFILLDGLQNPQNMGAVIRSAFALGFDKLIMSEDCADIYSPKCLRSAMGGIFHIKAYTVPRLSMAVEALTKIGIRTYCTLLDDKSLSLESIDFIPSDCFVIGNEGHGVSDEVKNTCTHSLYIPMNEGAESLNASVAAGIVMYEMKKIKN